MAEDFSVKLKIDTTAYDKGLTDAEKKALQAGKAIEEVLNVKPNSNTAVFSDSLKKAQDEANKLKENLAQVILTQGKSGAAYQEAVTKLMAATAEADKLELALKDAGNAARVIQPPKLSGGEQFANSLKSSKEQAEKLKLELAQIVATQGKNSTAYDDAVKKLKQATDEAEKLESALSDAGQAIAPNDAKSGFGALADSFKQGQLQAGGMGSALGGVASSLGSMISPVGLATAGVGALAAGLTASITIGKEFETNLQAVSAVTGVSGAALDDIGDRAVNLSKKFGGKAADQLDVFTTTLSKIGPQFANSAEDLSKFADNVNILGKTDATLGAKGAVDAITGAIGQFNINVNDAAEVSKASGRFADVFAQSAALGSAPVSKLAESIAVVGGTMAGANVSFEETNVALQVLAKRSILGSQAGTALGAVVNKLQAASGPAADKLIEMGTSSEELGKILTSQGLGAAMDKLRDRMGTLGSTAEKNAFLVSLFGETGLGAAQALLGEEQAYKDFQAGISQTGAAAEQAGKNMATFDQAMLRLTANFEAIAITVYKTISPALSFFANTVARLFTGELFQDLGLSNTFNGIAKVFANLSVAAQSMYKKIEPIINAIGYLIGGVLFVAFQSIKLQLQIIINAVGKAMDVIGNALSPLADLFTDIANSIGGTTTSIADVDAVFNAIADTITRVLSKAFDVLGGILKFVVGVITSLVRVVIEVGKFLYNLGVTAVDITKSIYNFANSFSFVRTAIQGTIGFITDITNKVGGFISKILEFLGLIDKTPENKAVKETAKQTGEVAKQQEQVKEAVKETAKVEADKNAKNKEAQKTALQLALDTLKAKKAESDENIRQLEIQEKRDAISKGLNKIDETQTKKINEAKLKANQQLLLDAEKILKIQKDSTGFATGTALKLDVKKGETFQTVSDEFTKLQEDVANTQLALNADVKISTPEQQFKDLENNLKKGLSIAIESGASLGLEAFSLETSLAVEKAKQRFDALTKLVAAGGFKDDGETKAQLADLQKFIIDSEKKIADEKFKKRTEIQDLEISLIEDTAKRELEQKIVSIQRARDKDLEIAGLTESQISRIKIKAEVDIAKLRSDFAKKNANEQKDVLSNVVDSFAQSLAALDFGFEVKSVDALNQKISDIKSSSEQAQQALKAAVEEEEKLSQTQITAKNYKEQLQAQADASQKRIDAEKAVADSTVSIQQEMFLRLGAELAKFTETTIAERKKVLDAYLAANQLEADSKAIVAERERAVNDARNAQQIAATNLALENNATTLAAYETANTNLLAQQNLLKEAQTAQAEAAKKSAEQQTAFYEQLAVSAGASVTSLIASGQSAGKALLAVAFDTASALVNMYIPSILALVQSIIPPPFGTIAGGIAVAGIKALLAQAKSAAGFEQGGFTGGTSTKEVRGVVHGKEFVANAQLTAREKPLFEYLHKGGSSFDYYKNKIAPTDIANRTLASGLDSLAMQVKGVQTAIADLSNSFESRTTVAMEVQHNPNLIFKTQSRNLKIRAGAW